MIYLIILILLIYGVLNIDINLFLCSNKTKNLYSIGYRKIALMSVKQKILYLSLLIIFVLLSGLSFKVGSDIPQYMLEFKTIQWNDFKLENFTFSDRQPLWLIFELISKTLWKEFFLFKLLIGIFVNCILFYFFRKQTKFIFSALLCYYVMMSFDINFNILRQSLAIASFIVAYQYLCGHHYIKTTMWILIAILFHNSAIILILIPILSFIEVKKYPNLFFILFVIICFVILILPSNGSLFILWLVSGDETLNKLSNIYMNGEYGSSEVSIIKNVMYLIIFYGVFYFYKKSGASNINLLLFLSYIFCFILSSKIPIIGRFRFYFLPFYIIALCNSVYWFVANVKIKRKCHKSLLIIALLTFFLYTPIRIYFIYNSRLGDKNYIQYYPYYSIFDPKTSQRRDRLIEYK